MIRDISAFGFGFGLCWFLSAASLGRSAWDPFAMMVICEANWVLWVRRK